MVQRIVVTQREIGSVCLFFFWMYPAIAAAQFEPI